MCANFWLILGDGVKIAPYVRGTIEFIIFKATDTLLDANSFDVGLIEERHEASDQNFTLL